MPPAHLLGTAKPPANTPPAHLLGTPKTPANKPPAHLLGTAKPPPILPPPHLLGSAKAAGPPVGQTQPTGPQEQEQPASYTGLQNGTEPATTDPKDARSKASRSHPICDLKPTADSALIAAFLASKRRKIGSHHDQGHVASEHTQDDGGSVLEREEDEMEREEECRNLSMDLDPEPFGNEVEEVLNIDVELEPGPEPDLDQARNEEEERMWMPSAEEVGEERDDQEREYSIDPEPETIADEAEWLPDDFVIDESLVLEVKLHPSAPVAYITLQTSELVQALLQDGARSQRIGDVRINPLVANMSDDRGVVVFWKNPCSLSAEAISDHFHRRLASLRGTALTSEHVGDEFEPQFPANGQEEEEEQWVAEGHLEDARGGQPLVLQVTLHWSKPIAFVTLQSAEMARAALQDPTLGTHIQAVPIARLASNKKDEKGVVVFWKDGFALSEQAIADHFEKRLASLQVISL